MRSIELDYFIILVLRDTATEERLKTRFSQILRGLRGSLELVPKHFKQMQDEGGDFCLVNTLGGTIYTMAALKKFKFESEWIHGQLVKNEKYSLEQVEATMQKLLELGLIIEKEGHYIRGKEVSGVIRPFSPREAFRMYQPTAVELYDLYDDVPAYGYIRTVSAETHHGGQRNGGDRRRVWTL